MAFDLLITVDWDYYRKFMSVNMDGALVMTRAVFGHMQARGGGAIVNQSSTAAWLYAGFYALAKVGINGLTQQLAHELGGMNIRVNAIAPGPTDTEATRKQAGDAAQGAGQGPRDQADGHAAGHGRRLPVPALRRGVLGDRPDRQRRRRAGLPMTEFPMRAVGFVGLGNIGKPMALRLADGTLPLWVHDVAPEPLAELEQAGAHVATDLAELAAHVDLLCVMVRDDDQVREVLGGVVGRGAPRRRTAADRGDPLHRRADARRPSWPTWPSGTAYACSTHRSAAARWARPTGRWRSWSAAPRRRTPRPSPRCR